MAKPAVESDIIAQGKQIREAKNALTVKLWRKLCTNVAVDVNVKSDWMFYFKVQEDETDRMKQIFLNHV